MRVRVLFIISQTNRGRWKKQSHDNKRTTTNTSKAHNDNTERGAHITAHFTAARNPTASIYFGAIRRMRLTHSAVVNLNEAATPARKKRHKKEQTASRASVGPNKYDSALDRPRRGVRAMHRLSR